MNYRKYWLIGLWVWAGCSGLAAQTADTLLMQVLPHEPRGVQVYWLPTRADIWDKGNTLGYRLTRRRGNGPEEELLDKALPQSRAWFQAEKELAYNLMPLVGEVLYDPDFKKEIGGKTVALQTRYSYLVNESENNIHIAKALGLGYVDTLWTDQKDTRYTVALTENGRVIARGEALVPAQNTPIVRNPQLLLPYQLPNNQPLSGLRGAPTFDDTDYLTLLARPMGDSIVLRWAPNRPNAWMRSRMNGYTLTRYGMGNRPLPDRWQQLTEAQLSDSLATLEPEQVTLVENFKPWPKETLNRPGVIADSMALVAAQSLYGTRDTLAREDMFSRWSDSEMRFSFAMLAADRSPLAADILALRWVDRQVKKGQSYMYVLEANGFTLIAGAPYVLVANTPADTLYKPQGVSCISGDHYIRLKWSALNDDHFSAYRVERSDDGGVSWQLRSAPAFLQTANTDHPDEENDHYYIDSVPENYKTYLYRLSGMDAFGAWSGGTMAQGKARDLTPNGEPFFTYAQLLPTGGIALAWQVEKDTLDLAGFDLAVSDNLESGYVPVGNRLPAAQRQFIFTGINPAARSYYFMVTTIDTAGNRHASVPTFIQVVDTIPPAIPLDLAGKIDSNGIVTLFWKHNTEPDLIGYRVYFGNTPQDEFSQITPQAVPQNKYQDTIELNTTTEFIYYRIVAEDKMHNLSLFSPILALQRPDRVPPVTPLMRETGIGARHLRVRWEPSPNIDVVQYVVYRRPGGADTLDWTPLGRVHRDSLAFTDTSAQLEVLYDYSVRALDDAGLYSGYAFPAYGRLAFSGQGGQVQSLKARYEPAMRAVVLNWQWEENKLPALLRGQEYYFFLYRAEGDSELYEKYQQLGSRVRQYTDRGLNTDGNYRYRLKIVYADGKSGELSDAAMVEVRKGK
jgi:uncharacterized protein